MQVNEQLPSMSQVSDTNDVGCYNRSLPYPRNIQIQPSLADVRSALLGDMATDSGKPLGNIIPVFKTLPADLLTPVAAYLRMTDGAKKGNHGFLCESVTGGEKVGRYSFVGSSELV